MGAWANYDMKIEEELDKTEEMQWDMYYRTLLPDHLEQFQRAYSGALEDREQALALYRDGLVVRHAARVQRLLKQKRKTLTQKYLSEIIDQIENAQQEADLELETDIGSTEDGQRKELESRNNDDIQRMQLDIIDTLLDINDYECLEMVQDIVREAYKRQF